MRRLALVRRLPAVCGYFSRLGRCVEGTRPPAHDEPAYRVHEPRTYCVANMPGVVSHSSTYALTNVARPDVMAAASHGRPGACTADPAFAAGPTAHAGTSHDPYRRMMGVAR